ncbi:glycosyltransferase, partial [Yersinia enterocolitica]
MYISQENTGISVVRNMGLSVSTGEYITFLDAD